MKRSAPIWSSAAASAAPGCDTPIQQLRRKYSVALRGSTCSSAKRSSPILPVSRIEARYPSSCSSIGGSHAQPISVITKRRRGNRSNTPETSSCTNGRCE